MLSIPDRYQPTGEVLHGGMSNVYICNDVLLDRTVAVKSIGDPSQLGRVIDEIKALQLLRSKHVVQIYDYFVDSASQQIGIVEEFVPGPGLQEYPPTGSSLLVDDYFFFSTRWLQAYPIFTSKELFIEILSQTISSAVTGGSLKLLILVWHDSLV
jgi:serine/threonine protein kinase